jgi:hypothetical protein
MKIIGIDPGQTGALAVMQAGKIATLLDMPTIPRLHGKGQQVDVMREDRGPGVVFF